DIPFLGGMQEEHDEFVGDLQDRDIRVLYLDRLMGDVLKRPEAKAQLIQQVCAAELSPAIAPDLMNEALVPNELLLRILFRGITTNEYYELTGRESLHTGTKDSFILLPIPNAYFSRDPAVVVGERVISCKMHFVERVRETILLRTLLEHHPDFTRHEILYGSTNSPVEDRPFTIEGGDVIVLNEESLLIGVSERTRSETVKALARNAFAGGHLKRCYEIPIPFERTFMHLDTVFTIVDRGVVVWFPGVMDRLEKIARLSSDGNGGMTRVIETRNITQILSEEFGTELKVIRTGGGDDHFASREQRTDGTNILAIAPGVACTYRRNQRTIAAMQKAGIECLSISGSELVRGLGGPRCMTMPLRRRPSA
ncbi:MAG TPA: arginine deiminase family protein, partial [Phycisphaerae bacterium]|nr:arginine deiminase family protein [Phycisphaerae bacterium]